MRRNVLRRGVGALALALAVGSGAGVGVAVVNASPALAADAPSVPKYDLSFVTDPSGTNGSAPADPAEGPASSARVTNGARGLASAGGGAFYLSSANRVVKLTPTGTGDYTVMRLVGTGTSARSLVPDGAVAATSAFGSLGAVAVDGAGRLYVVDAIFNAIYRVEADGTVTRVVGTGAFGSPGSGPYPGGSLGTAFGTIAALAFDAAGDLYFSSQGQVFKVSEPAKPGSRPVTWVAGSSSYSGTMKPSRTPQPATSVGFGAVSDGGLAFAPDGALLVAANGWLSRVVNGQLTLYAGGEGTTALGESPTPVTSTVVYPGALSVDANGVIFFRAGDGVAALVPGAVPTVQRVAGSGDMQSAPVAGPALSSPLPGGSVLARDPDSGAIVTFVTRTVVTGMFSMTFYNYVVKLSPVALGPGVPGKPSAVAGYGSARVSVAPSTTGVAADSYTVTASPGGASCTVAASASPLSCVVSGLTAGATYTFTATASAGAGAAAKMSAASIASDPVTVLTPKTVTVTADAKSKVYGEADPALTYQVSGLDPGDSLSTAPSCTRVAGEDVGARAITCSGASVADAAKYTLSYVGADLTITQRAVTVTPKGYSRAYGETLPDTYGSDITSGTLVAGDAITGSCGVAGTPRAVGSYPITCSLSAGANYALTLGAANLVITKATGAVVPDAKTITYGDDLPQFTYDVSGLEPTYQLAQAPTCGVDGPAVDAGTYLISCGGGSDPNYDLDRSATARLTVTKARAVVVPQAQTVVAGSGGPEFTFDVQGVKPGYQLATAPTCGVDGDHSAPGSYTITCAGGEDDNYTVDHSATATLTVQASAPSITDEPDDAAAFAGAGATFTVGVAGAPAPSVQWQVSADRGSTWSDVAGATDPTLALTVDAAKNGYLYRAKVSNIAGTVLSRAAKLTVSRDLPVPRGVLATRGDSQVALTWSPPTLPKGTLAPTGYVVRGEVGGRKVALCEVAVGDPLSCTITGLTNGRGYTFEVAAVSAAGAGKAAVVKVTPVRAVVVLQQPEAVTVRQGATFTLSAQVSADPLPTLRWEQSSNGGRTWSITGKATVGTSSTLSARAILTDSGRLYRLRIGQPGGGNTYTAAVAVTVTR